jgi:uracil-DNA glycosylase family 4
MLTQKQIRMLQLLDKQVNGCKDCTLSNYDSLIPYWSTESKYVIIGESPTLTEVRKQVPFMGAAGDILATELDKVGFKSKDFLIIHTVQCSIKPKPDEDSMQHCQNFLRKYIRVIKPEKILCLGNYAKYIFTGDITGVLRKRGKFREYEIGNEKYPVLFTIHPAYCTYNQEEGIPMLAEDIKLFMDTKFERKSDWFFSEDDFNLF